MNGQIFEREYATEFKQIFETGCQEHIGVKIEAAETIDREIPEKIVTLNSYGKRVEHGPVLGKLGVNEFLDLRVIEKQVLEIRIEQAQVCSGRLSQERQVSALVRLDDPPWNFLHHEFILSFIELYSIALGMTSVRLVEKALVRRAAQVDAVGVAVGSQITSVGAGVTRRPKLSPVRANLWGQVVGDLVRAHDRGGSLSPGRKRSLNQRENNLDRHAFAQQPDDYGQVCRRVC